MKKKLYEENPQMKKTQMKKYFVEESGTSFHQKEHHNRIQCPQLDLDKNWSNLRI